MNPTPPPDLQVLGTAVLLQGRALKVIASLAAVGAANVSRRDGIELAGPTLRLINTLADVANNPPPPMPASGHADVRKEPGPAGSELVGTAAIAEELGMSEEHVRRLARGHCLPAHRAGRAWLFDLAEVRSYRAQHDTTYHQDRSHTDG